MVNDYTTPDAADAADEADDLFADEVLAPPAPAPATAAAVPAPAPAEAAPVAATAQPTEADALFSDEALAPPQSSALGAFGRSAELGVVPALTGIPAAAAGAEAGATVGALAGPVGAIAGGIVGGLGGMFVGAMGGERLQDYALSKLSDEDRKRLNLTDEQRLVDEAQHPYASQLGGLVPYLVTSSPFSPKAVEREMSALEKFMSKPVVQRGMGGGLMGAWELGQEALNDEVDWTKVATATAFGVIFNHQNRIGQYLHNIGARPVQRITGRVGGELPAEEQEPARSMGGALFSPREMPDPRNPTLRELDAAGVMGPGNSEATYMGLAKRPALEELFAHKRLEEEYDALYGPQPPTPEQITFTARKMEPDLFDARDALEGQRKSIEASIELYRSPSIEQYNEVRGQIATLEEQLAGEKNKDAQRKIRTQIRVLTSERDAMWSRRQGELQGKVDDNLTKLYNELAAVNTQIREQGRDIARAHRLASEALTGGSMSIEHRFGEEEAATAAAVDAEAKAAMPTIDMAAERAKIARDFKAEMLTAGRPEEEAESASQLIASRFVARAAAFNGARGTPHEMYLADHARITKWEPGKRQPPTGGAPPAPPAGPAPEAGPSVMRAAEARLAGGVDFAPSEAVAADTAPTLPEVPTEQVAPAVEGAVSVMPEAGAQPAPEAPAAPAGPGVGDVITMNGTRYKIAALDDNKVSLTPARAKDKAAAVALPRRAFDAMFADHAAEAGKVEGETATLNGEKLDAKTVALIMERQAAKKAEASAAPVERAPAPDTAALKRQMMDEALKSDEEFYAPPREEEPTGTPLQPTLDAANAEYARLRADPQAEPDFDAADPDYVMSLALKNNDKDVWMRLKPEDWTEELWSKDFDEQRRLMEMTPEQRERYEAGMNAASKARSQFFGRNAWELKLGNENVKYDRAAMQEAWKAYDTIVAAADGPYDREKVLSLFSEKARPKAEKLLDAGKHGPDEFDLFKLWAEDHPQAGVKNFNELLEYGRPKPGDDYMRLDQRNIDSPYWELSNKLLHNEETAGRLRPANDTGASRAAEAPSAGIPAHRVTTAAGTKIDVRPKLVEASELLASSDKGYDASLQPRNRDRAASQGQIREIAGKLVPDRLGMSSEADRGAPIVGSDNMVESGNGRVMALREAYRQDGPAASRYRRWLQEQGYDVTGMKEPVLVRERVTEMTPEERRKFTVEANQSATLAMSASERAMADARSLSTNTLDLIVNPDDLGAIKNRPFIQAFIKTLPQAEQGAMTTAEGGLSAEGLSRVRNAVLAKAYGDAALMARIAEATSDEVKSISNALTAGAPYWAKMRADVEAGNVRADMDLTPELMEAVAKTAELRSKGVKLDQFLAQMDAFDRLNAQVEAWMRMFYNDTGRRAASGQVIAERIKYYAEEARKVSAEEGLSFGLPPVRPEDVQANAAQRGRESAAAEGQANLFERGGAGVREGGAEGGQGAGRPISGEGGGRSGETGAGGDQGGQSDGRTLEQRAGRGREERALGKIILKANGQREIWLKPEANPSTIIHETGHDFLEQLAADAVHEAAPQQLRDDLETVKGWVGWKDGQKAFTTKQHEKFARGFERYLYDGVAPSQQLAVVFQRFANWLREVYRTVSGLKTPEAIPADIRAVFDRLLAVDPHSVTIAGDADVRRSMSDIHMDEARAVVPERAGPMADRAMAEAARGIAELPREIRNELGAAAERAGVGRSAVGLAGSGERAGGMAADRDGPSIVTRGGSARSGDGAQFVGGSADAGSGGSGGREGAARGAGGAGDGGDGRDDAFARGGRFVDRAGNIRLENLTNSESVKEAIREIAYGHNGFITERRGRISDEAVLSLAEEIGFDGAEDLVNRWVVGQALNAEEIMALRLLVRDSASDLHGKAKAVAEGGDWKAVRDYAVAKERHIAIQRTVSGVTAEAGRALRAFRDISGSTKAKSIEKLMREATGQTLFQLRDEATLLAGLDSEIAVNRNVRTIGSNMGEGLLEYATNNLISGPITHTVYTISNQELALWKALVETPFRAVISNAMKAAGKDIKPEEMTRFGEVWQQLLGMGQGFAPALKAAGQSMRVGLTTRLPRETMKNLPGIRPGQEVVEAPMVDMAYTLKEIVPDMFAAMRGSVDALSAYGKMLAMGQEGEPFFRWSRNPLYKFPDAKIRGVTVPVGGVVNSPSRLVSSLHAFNRIQFYFMELNAEAFRKASAELEVGTIRPEDFNRRLAELKAAPDALMIDRAQQAATESTQMAPGGQMTQRLSRFVNSPIGGPGGPPLLRFIDPFIHISSNVLSGAFLKRTPLGFLSGPIREDLLGKNGGQAQFNAMSRMAAGTSVLAFMGMMKAQGYITGSAPEDKAEAATWAMAGYQPYSIKINGTWYPYHRLGVLGLLMGIGADLYDVGDHFAKSAASYSKDDLKKMDEEMMQAMGALLHSISNNVMEESFMRGPAELMKAVEGGENAMSRYVRNFVSTMFVPFSVGMSQVARMVDPVSRQARTLTDAVKNKIPGMSQKLLPRRNMWGEPIMSQTSTATKSATADPVNVELYRLGVAKAPVERKIYGVELSDQQYDDYQRIAGRMARMQVELMINSSGWQRVPDPMKKVQIEKTIDAQREAARHLMMMKYRQIPQEAKDAKRRRFTEIETRAVP